MDINDARIIVTVLAFAAFIGIVAWAYSGRRKAVFDAAARLPLEEDETMAARGAGDPAQFRRGD